MEFNGVSINYNIIKYLLYISNYKVIGDIYRVGKYPIGRVKTYLVLNSSHTAVIFSTILILIPFTFSNALGSISKMLISSA